MKQMKQMKQMKHSILLIGLELLTWRRAKHISYCAQLGLEEGFDSNNVEYFTLPSVWAYRIKDILRGRKFDQVWIEVVHSKFSDQFCQELKQIAPIRVGFLLESAQYSGEEYRRHPFLRGRENVIKNYIQYLTHLVVCDENDVNYFQREIPSFWWPQAVPKRFISESTALSKAQQAIFSGAVYGERKAWINNSEVKKFLVRQPSSEKNTSCPGQFNRLNLAHYLLMKTPLPITEKQFTKYMESLRLIRRSCFELWLASLHSGCAVVNLPHLVKTYAGRVVEAMAAGVPVISWKIPDRPKNTALFQQGRDILLFSKDDPGQLTAHIKKLINDPAMGQEMVKNAREKVLRYHTIEKRVEQILQWTIHGQEPEYYG
jgi:glycosyltransferase involved in cell wall biosynthesis